MFSGMTFGWGVTGSFCSIDEIFPQIEKIIEKGAKIIPVVSEKVLLTSTRFGNNDETIKKLEKITGNRCVNNITGAEPIGPQKLLNAFIIAPATGSTIAKLTYGMSDGTVLMAAKATLRNNLPIIIAISTNDGLGVSAKNIGELLNRKNVFIVPFSQDDFQNKPNSLKSDMNMICMTVKDALKNKQIQPVLR